jgi:putative nucleotidyltransferase with HDIG domain
VTARPGLRPGHRARRFFGMLWPLGPSRADDAWARAQLLDGEVRLWRRMGRADRRHGVAVARRTAAALGPAADRAVLAAALLHDVGKADSRLGPVGRALATVVGLGGGRERALALSRRRGLARRVGLYLRHGEIGADMLALAGADPLTVAWAREHHQPPASWSVPPAVGAALAAADDD